MSNAPSNFRRGDVKCAVQAMQSAGLKVGRVELHGGKVLIIPAGDEEIGADSNNSFDKIRENARWNQKSAKSGVAGRDAGEQLHAHTAMVGAICSGGERQ